MPNDGNDKGSKEARTRRNWWYKAKRFIIRDTGMYDMGDNAQLNINENHINAGVVFITERLAPNTSFSDWHGPGGARGTPGTCGTLNRLLIYRFQNLINREYRRPK